MCKAQKLQTVDICWKTGPHNRKMRDFRYCWSYPAALLKKDESAMMRFFLTLKQAITDSKTREFCYLRFASAIMDNNASSWICIDRGAPKSWYSSNSRQISNVHEHHEANSVRAFSRWERTNLLAGLGLYIAPNSLRQLTSGNATLILHS
jgi:hypothetical protein